MFDTLPKIVKVPSALMEARNKWKESKDKGLWERLSSVWDAFWKEMKGVKEEKKEVQQKTDEEVQECTDEMLDGHKKVLGVEDLKGDDKTLMEEILGMCIGSEAMASPDVKKSLGGKLTDVMNDKAVELSADESEQAAAIGLMTLAQLREQYPTKAEFKKVLNRLMKLSEKSKFPFKKFMEGKFYEKFKLSFDKVRLVTRFGIYNIADAYKISQLTNENLSDEDLTAMIPLLNKYFFKNTKPDNVQRAVVFLREMFIKKDINVDKMTEFAFLIDPADYKRLANLLRYEQEGQQAA